jgi:hypothetical protein
LRTASSAASVAVRRRSSSVRDSVSYSSSSFRCASQKRSVWRSIALRHASPAALSRNAFIGLVGQSIGVSAMSSSVQPSRPRPVADAVDEDVRAKSYSERRAGSTAPPQS